MAITREERLARRRQHYLANREKRLEEAAAYRTENRERMNEAKRVSYKANREQRLRDATEYRTKNPERVKAAMAAWYRRKGAAHARERYRSDPERSLAAARRWKAKNPDYHRTHALDAYYADVEAGRARVRASRAANVEYHRQRFTQWAKRNPDRVRDIARRRRARKIAATIEEFNEIEIFERDRWRCYICNTQVLLDIPAYEPARAVLEHVVSLANGGAHSRLNTRCACFRCNSMKGAHLTPEQVRERLQTAVDATRTE